MSGRSPAGTRRTTCCQYRASCVRRLMGPDRRSSPCLLRPRVARFMKRSGMDTSGCRLLTRTGYNQFVIALLVGSGWA